MEEKNMKTKKSPKTPTVPSGKKWFDLIAQVKEENDALTEILKRGSDERAKSNLEYLEKRQKSFNAIHGIQRSGVPSRVVTGKHKRSPYPHKTSKVEPRNVSELSSFAVMEFDTPVTNVDKWPKRKTPARRILSPVKLNDYNNKRHKDTFVLSGDAIPPSLATTL